MLSEAWRAFAVESSNNVHTQELAVVLLGGTFVQVFANLPVFLQNISSWARALVAALCVLADEVTWFRGLVTLIQIHTGCACDICCVAQPAVAAEGANAVDALSVLAEVGQNLALIDVSPISGVPWAMRTHFLVLGGSKKGAELTLRSPTAPTVAAALRFGDQVAVGGRHLAHGLQYFSEAEALAGVNTLCARGTDFKTLIAVAAVTSHRVDAAAVGADSRLGAALILICAALSIRSALHSWWADAHEGANEILAQHSSRLAVVQTLCTLIQISAHSSVISEGVSRWTRALIGAKGVDAAEGTKQRIRCALINIFTCHHGPWLKALITGAFEASHHVGAGTIPTGVADGAFICIHTVDSCVVQVVPKGALAAEGAISINAGPVDADTQVL